MKKKIIVLSFLILAASVLVSCGTSSKTSTSMTSTTSPATSTTGAGSVVLTVTNGSTIKTYSLEDLQAFTPVTGTGGTLVTGLSSYQGVALTDLLNAVGGIAKGDSVTITATFHYTASLTYDQITNSTFNTYDANGNRVTPTTKPVIVLIYSANGKPLDIGAPLGITGPTELGIISTQNLVTDSSMWLGSLEKIDIIH